MDDEVMETESSAQRAASSLSSPLCTGVLVKLTIKAGVARERVMAEMPAEMKATAMLYLEGKIQQWYSLTDAPGVMFLFNATTEAEAGTMTAELPLVREGLADLRFTRVGPLIPMALLLVAAFHSGVNPGDG